MFSSGRAEHFVWEDREVHFDVANTGLRRGEFLVDARDNVEDTKGNMGDRGVLSVTNLRVRWIKSNSRYPVNLSIGLEVVRDIELEVKTNRVKPTAEMRICTHGTECDYLFIFTCEAPHRIFTSIINTHAAYDFSRMYRDLRLRSVVLREGHLILLPQEQIYTKVPGVANLTVDQGNLGTMFITNVRMVWYAHATENFNVSIPYLQMQSVKIASSKFGRVFCIETFETPKSYTFGFYVESMEKLDEIYKEVTSLHRLFTVNPIFGVDVNVEMWEEPKQSGPVDDVEIITTDEVSDSFASYFADGAKKGNRARPVFDPSVGLAVEHSEASLQELWQI